MTNPRQTLWASQILRAQLADQVQVRPIAQLPRPAYNFDSTEAWLLFESISSQPCVGGMHCHAVHRITGEVRDLGWLGE